MTDQQVEHRNYTPNSQNCIIHLLCMGLQSPANIGAVFRIADAFGVHQLQFTTPIDLASHRLRKMARETHKIVPYRIITSVIDTLQEYIEDGYTLVALELTGASIPILEMPKAQSNILLIIGHEKYGIPSEILEIVNYTIHIPMFGHNSSMNVAQATAIALYELSIVRS